MMNLREVATASASSVGRMKATSLTKAEANFNDAVGYKAQGEKATRGHGQTISLVSP